MKALSSLNWQYKFLVQFLVMVACAAVWMFHGLAPVSSLVYIPVVIFLFAVRTLLDDRITGRILALSLLGFLLCFSLLRLAPPLAMVVFLLLATGQFIGQGVQDRTNA